MSKESDGGVSVENAEELAVKTCPDGAVDIGIKGIDEEWQVLHWSKEDDEPKMTDRDYDETFGDKPDGKTITHVQTKDSTSKSQPGKGF